VIELGGLKQPKLSLGLLFSLLLWNQFLL